MNRDDAAAVVRRYYKAFQAGDAVAVHEALGRVLAPEFVLDSPIVRDRLGAPATGAQGAAIAVQAAVLLQHAEVTSLHFTIDGAAVVALIRFPTPAGAVWQSEHFQLDPATGTITGLRSFYDPRPLLSR
ncbi:MAG: hypothetical protein ACTHMS_03770 [Jatrophihabitans sp.]|uniref:hypothetical protein n=1 Tax=Jatrophihabitans sp. TaxID=1932789 RepID=UPI003F82133B